MTDQGALERAREPSEEALRAAARCLGESLTNIRGGLPGPSARVVMFARAFDAFATSRLTAAASEARAAAIREERERVRDKLAELFKPSYGNALAGQLGVSVLATPALEEKT